MPRQELLVGNILAVADKRLTLHRIERFHVKRLWVFLLDDEALDVGHLAVDLGHFNAGHIGLVVLLEDLLHRSLAYPLAVVVDQVDLGALFDGVLDGQEAPLFLQVIAEDCQTGAVVDALHTAYALVVVHRRCAAGGGLADGALGAAEGAGVAGEAIEAVELHERLGFHALLAGQVGLVEQSHGVLLAVDILARDVEVFVIIVADTELIGNLVGCLTAAEHGTGTLADAHGVADAVDVVTEEFLALGEQLVVGH